uniref:Uncharacterized protein n=1 Tax=Rhizophora mucronata TaxID=61149 RepID=A0A2P2PSX9_RHIMU
MLKQNIFSIKARMEIWMSIWYGSLQCVILMEDWVLHSLLCL